MVHSSVSQFRTYFYGFITVAIVVCLIVQFCAIYYKFMILEPEKLGKYPPGYEGGGRK